MKYRHFVLLIFSLMLSGCDRPEQAEVPVSGGGGGPIEGINHTSWAINHFSVDGQNAVDVIGPYQGGGGGGSYGAPAVWTPGLRVKVEWETGVAFADDVPEIPKPKRPNTKGLDEKEYYRVWQAYSDQKQEWYDKINAFKKQHTRIVPVPDYSGQKTCGITVHFFPCDQIKVTTSCADYGSPDYPIKDPVHMEKPNVCSQ